MFFNFGIKSFDDRFVYDRGKKKFFNFRSSKADYALFKIGAKLSRISVFDERRKKSYLIDYLLYV